jgi:hypothetical protein
MLTMLRMVQVSLAAPNFSDEKKSGRDFFGFSVTMRLDSEFGQT